MGFSASSPSSRAANKREKHSSAQLDWRRLRSRPEPGLSDARARRTFSHFSIIKVSRETASPVDMRGANWEIDQRNCASPSCQSGGNIFSAFYVISKAREKKVFATLVGRGSNFPNPLDEETFISGTLEAWVWPLPHSRTLGCKQLDVRLLPGSFRF
jgi:hypothetical protein